MYDLLRPSPYRLIIDHRTFSFFTYTLTNALALGKLFFFFYIGPTTTLFTLRRLNLPPKPSRKSEVGSGIVAAPDALLGRTSLSPSGAVIPSLI